MKLNPEQIWRIEMAKINLLEIETLTPAELHYLACTQNPSEMHVNSILDHKKCDLATALIIYGKFSAGYHQQFPLEGAMDSDHKLNFSDLVTKLNGNFFKTEIFFYNPIEFIYRYEDDYSNGKLTKLWDHPEVAKKEINGEKVEYSGERIEGYSIIQDPLSPSFIKLISNFFEENDVNFDYFYPDLYDLTCPIDDYNLIFNNFSFDLNTGAMRYAISFDYYIESDSKIISGKKTLTGLGNSITNAMQTATSNWEKQCAGELMKLLK
jgi:hypothetical protein